MSSYSSLLSPSPVDQLQIGGYADDDDDDDDMAVAAAVSSYLSFDIDVAEDYFPPEADCFRSEQQAPAPILTSLQLPSSEGLSNHDKIDNVSTRGGGGDARSFPKSKSSKIAFKTRSEVEVLDDGYRWRKYGKKMVKDSPNPRNYYRCSSEGCDVKKRVERERDDARFVITTYDGVHNHPAAPLPPPRGCAGYSLGQPQGRPRVDEEDGTSSISSSVEGRCFLDMKLHAAGGAGGRPAPPRAV